MTAPPGATGSPRPRLPLSGRVIHPGE